MATRHNSMGLVVLGAGGLLAGTILRASRLGGFSATGLNHAQLDITDPRCVRAALRTLRPDIVVNCAGYTKVDAAESYSDAAYRANALGAGIVAETAAAVDAKVVYLSTDYVFNGTKRSPYVESDKPDPLGVYGRTKLRGEAATAEHNDRHYIVRTAWLFGDDGPNFVDTVLNKATEAGDLRIVNDQIGSPTYTLDLAKAILSLCQRSDYGVYHITGGGSCTWYELAVATVKLAHLSCSIKSCTTEQAGTVAARPRYSALESERHAAPLMPHWRRGLASYLTGRVSRT